MTIETSDLDKQRTQQLFDGEFNHFHSLMMEMAGLVQHQLDRTMQALDDGDIQLAEMVLSRNKDIDQYKAQIDTEVLSVLTQHCPMANELRTVISISKIAGELDKIGCEIANFARLVTVLFDPKTSDPNPNLLTDIVKIGNRVKMMLGKLMAVLEKRELNQADMLLRHERDCETELQEGIARQLSFILQDARLIGRALDIMQIMKSLECCGEHCRNIAEYTLLMVDGGDACNREQVAPVDC